MEKKISVSKIIMEIDSLLKNNEDERAEELLIDAVNRYTKLEPDDITGQVILLNELGGFYRNRGNLEKGKAHYLNARKLLEVQMDGDDNRVKDERLITNYATTLNNLAGLYRLDRQYDKALKTYDDAILFYERCADCIVPDYVASAYSNKGTVFLDMKEFGQARTMFLKAKEILETAGDYKSAMAAVLSNLGFLSVFDKKQSEAIEYFSRAKNLFEEVGNMEMANNCASLKYQLESK